jgi:hypothetical protein
LGQGYPYPSHYVPIATSLPQTAEYYLLITNDIMLKCAEPLRNELKSLEKQPDVNKRRVEETTMLIATLEHSALRAKLSEPRCQQLLVTHFSRIYWRFRSAVPSQFVYPLVQSSSGIKELSLLNYLADPILNGIFFL